MSIEDIKVNLEDKKTTISDRSPEEKQAFNKLGVIMKVLTPQGAPATTIHLLPYKNQSDKITIV